MHDAFDFAHHEDTLRSIKPQSEQARILTLMLQDVCSCCDFIQSYAKDSQFCTSSSFCLIGFRKHAIFNSRGKRTFKNIDGGPVDNQSRSCPMMVACRTPKGLRGPGYHFYGDYCFPNFGRRGKNIDSSFRRRWVVLDDFLVTDPIFVIELDAKIREIPYGFNSRFSL